MAPIRVYFPTTSADEGLAFQTREENCSTIFHRDRPWESLIENASELYAKANDHCKLYIAKGLIEHMRHENPAGRFYQFQQNNVWRCLSPKQVLKVTQAALFNTHANRKQESALIVPIAQTEKKVASDVSVERLRKKFVSILRVVANSSLTQGEQNSRIASIAKDAIEFSKAVEAAAHKHVDIMEDYDSDDDSTAPPRRKCKQQRLLPKDYFGDNMRPFVLPKWPVAVQSLPKFSITDCCPVWHDSNPIRPWQLAKLCET